MTGPHSGPDAAAAMPTSGPEPGDDWANDAVVGEVLADERQVGDVAHAEAGVGGHQPADTPSVPVPGVVLRRDRVVHMPRGHDGREGGQGCDRGETQPALAPSRAVGQVEHPRHEKAGEDDPGPRPTEVDPEQERRPTPRPPMAGLGHEGGADDERERAGQPRDEADGQQSGKRAGRRRQPNCERGDRGAQQEGAAGPDGPGERRREQRSGEVASRVRRVQCAGLGVGPAEIGAHCRKQQGIGEARQTQRDERPGGQPECQQQASVAVNTRRAGSAHPRIPSHRSRAPARTLVSGVRE